MMYKSIYVFLLFMIVLSCKEATVSSDKITEREVVDFIKRYDEAWNSKDTVTVDSLMGEQYIYFNSVGGTTKRKESLQFLGDPDYRLASANRFELEIIISGNVATVGSRWIGKGFWKSEAINDNQRCGITLQKSNGEIKLIAENCVEIKRDN